MLAQSVNHVTLDKARSPTKSEGDRANAKPYKYTNDCSTKSEWDSANAKPYKHTDDCSTKSDWDSAVFEMGCAERGWLTAIIQKGSQCSTVTALFINYCFV